MWFNPAVLAGWWVGRHCSSWSLVTCCFPWQCCCTGYEGLGCPHRCFGLLLLLLLLLALLRPCAIRLVLLLLLLALLLLWCPCLATG
jgi:hypothetical protein